MSLKSTPKILAVGIVLGVLCSLTLLMMRVSPFVHHVTWPPRFRAVAYPTLAGKIDTDLYLRIGGHSVLLGLKDHSTNGVWLVSAEHPNPVQAKTMAEMVARIMQSPKASGQSSGTLKTK